MAADQVVSRESPQSASGDYNVLRFIFQQLLRQVNTFHAAKVLSCTNSGGVSPVGYVDIQLMVNQVDGAGRSVANAVIHNVPYYRIQGGVNAIICDPQEGDLGFVAFAQRDISTFKNSLDQSNPGSPREFSISDAVWVCSWPADVTPENYVRFDGDGNIIITATGDITTNSVNATVNASANAVINAGTEAHVTAPQCVVDATTTINGNTTINGSLVVRDGVKAPSYAGLTAGTGTMTVHQATIDTATVAGKLVDTHTHTDPQGGTTGPMQ